MLTGVWRRWTPAKPVRQVAVAVVVLTGTLLVAPAQDRTRPVEAIVVALVLAVCVAAGLRGAWPVAATVAATAGVAAYLVLGGPYGPVQLVVSLCCVTVGLRCSARWAVAVGSVVSVLLSAALVTRSSWSSWLGATTVLAAWSVVFVVLPILVGVLVRVRREAVLRQRTELLARGAEAERLRLAQDVHDIAGHGFAVVSMQAGVALAVFDEQPDQARRCLEAVHLSADTALRDLHGMLDALRSPALGVSDVPELVDRVRAAGLVVELLSDGDPEPTGVVGEEVSTTVHRVVQEALTNVLRHAGPTTACVEITYRPDAVTVVVRDRGTGLRHPAVFRGGHGLSGLRSRAESLGGTLQVTDHPAGGVEVRARLPRPSDR